MRALRSRPPLVRLLVAAALACSLFAAACGSDDEDGGEPAAPATNTAAGTTASAETTAPAESASTAETTAAAAAAAFPVTIPHAFGETAIEAEPERVVAWGWGSADAAIALGTVPVAIPFQSYGGDDQGVLPWIAEKLVEQGAEVPTVLPDSAEEPPYEEIAAADPDLILAAYSGITEEQYELLSQIAPTVAYPGEAWATPWRELITIVGTALGKSAQATALLADIDAQIAEQASAHPELAGKAVAMVWDSAGTFYVYKRADPRAEFAEALGMSTAPSVDELATDESTFYFTLSYEQLDKLTSDVLVSFADTPELSQEFLESSHGQAMEQVTRGAVAEVVGTELVASVSPPTALSLTWGLERYVELLSGAAQKADAAG
jgi:iron complex transport system substrate-binding protein